MGDRTQRNRAWIVNHDQYNQLRKKNVMIITFVPIQLHIFARNIIDKESKCNDTFKSITFLFG